MKLTKASLLGISIIVTSLSLITYQATRSESSVTFYTPEEIYANPQQFSEKLFRVSGLVLKGSKIWDAQNSALSFAITDLKGHNFQVHYKGIPPDLFKEGQGVVVEGYLNKITSTLSENNLIEADLLMVKHSEVYDTKQDHSQMREAKLLESILKDQDVKKEKEKL